MSEHLETDTSDEGMGVHVRVTLWRLEWRESMLGSPLPPPPSREEPR